MDASAIPTNLRRLRRTQGLTQQELADRAGISRNAYRKLETGQSAPTVASLRALAKALDVRLEQLVEPSKELRAVRFRSHKRRRTRQQILVAWAAG